MVQGGDDFECLSFFSYIEDEKMGRPVGDLDRSRKPFWREFDEYMHERGEKSSNLFYAESAREREKPSAQTRFDSFSLHTTQTRRFFPYSLCRPTQRLRFQISSISRNR